MHKDFESAEQVSESPYGFVSRLAIPSASTSTRLKILKIDFTNPRHRALVKSIFKIFRRVEDLENETPGPG